VDVHTCEQMSSTENKTITGVGSIVAANEPNANSHLRFKLCSRQFLSIFQRDIAQLPTYFAHQILDFRKSTFFLVLTLTLI
jgi:hypothetical protein